MVRLAAMSKIKITFECVAVNNCGIKLNDSKKGKERKREAITGRIQEGIQVHYSQ